MENDFPPEFHKFTMYLVDDYRRFEGIDPANAFSEILQEIASDSVETVYFTIGSEEMGVLIDTLREKGFLSESFPNANEFLKLFSPDGKSWEFSLRNPWDGLSWNSAVSGIRREERIHPLLLRVLSKLYIDEKVRSDDYVSFWYGFPDGQSTFYPATGISPLKVEFHFRHKKEGYQSSTLRSIATSLGMAAYYGDQELIEGNPWERRDDNQSNTFGNTDEELGLPDPNDGEYLKGRNNTSEETDEESRKSIYDAPTKWTVDGEGDLVQLVERWLASEGLADDDDYYLSERDDWVRFFQHRRNYNLNFPTLVEFVEGLQAFGISLEVETKV